MCKHIHWNLMHPWSHIEVLNSDTLCMSNTVLRSGAFVSPTLLQPYRKECLRLRSGVLRSWEKWRLKSAQSGKSTPKQVVRLTVCCLSTLQVYIWQWSHILNADFALIWLELFTQYIAAYPCGFWGVCIVCCSYDFAWVWERGSKETGRDEAKPKSGEWKHKEESPAQTTEGDSEGQKPTLGKILL